MEIMGLCNPILWFGVLFAFGIITIPAYAKYRLGGGSKLFRSLFTIMMVFIPFLYMALALILMVCANGLIVFLTTHNIPHIGVNRSMDLLLWNNIFLLLVLVSMKRQLMKIVRSEVKNTVIESIHFGNKILMVSVCMMCSMVYLQNIWR